MAALVKAERGADPFSGTIYVFRAKRTDRIKLIFWDGSGVCLVAKRLEDGEFHWPRMQDGAMHLTAAQFSALFEGLDWKRVHAPSETRIPLKAGSRPRPIESAPFSLSFRAAKYAVLDP